MVDRQLRENGQQKHSILVSIYPEKEDHDFGL